MERILVVEDEKNIAKLLEYNLKQEGYDVVVADRGDVGLKKAESLKFDLVILDLMLPEINGMDICKKLKSNPKTQSLAILILTAKKTETDKVLGLEMGADDYMSKPFSTRELIARVRAILRRTGSKTQFKILRAGSLELHVDTHIVKLKDKALELRSKEFKLLKVFLESQGRVMTRDELLERVWGYEDALNLETRTVDIHIAQLRKKLKNEASRIVTVKNAGYRLDLES